MFNNIGLSKIIACFCVIIICLASIFHSQPEISYFFKMELNRYVLIIFWVFLVIHVFLFKGDLRVNLFDYAFLFLFLNLLVLGVIKYGAGTDLNALENLGYAAMLYIPIKVAVQTLDDGFLSKKLMVFYSITLAIILLKAVFIASSANNIHGDTFNSTYFSNYLALCIPLLFYIIKSNSSKAQNRFSYVIIAVIIVICIMNQARASILAIGLFFITQLNWTWVKKNLLLLVGLFAVLTIPAYLLITNKTASIKGRWFIWENCLSILKENPFGVGPGNFKQQYAVHQAKVLNNNPFDANFLLSDLNDYAFNDFLQYTIEGGILVIIPFLYISYLVFKSKNKHLTGFYLLVVTIGSTSYILHSFYTLFIIMISFCVFIKDEGQIKKANALVFIPGYVGLCWAILSFLAYKTKPKHAGSIYSSLLNSYRMADNNYLYDWSQQEFEKKNFKESINLLKKSGREDYDIDANLSLAISYENLGNFSLAEKHYKKANQILPRIFKPKRLLLNFYLQKQETEKAREVAKEIIKTPIKIPSKEIDKLKSKATLVLDSINKMNIFNNP